MGQDFADLRRTDAGSGEFQPTPNEPSERCEP